ncbi:hypothetical protein [Virgibacillus sp. DJP39]|uniref:hypothetical protein n=1 Tax=Virgibacillus sp. DJP39 TaxID=3409790 RepID=UPI003BB4E986
MFKKGNFIILMVILGLVLSACGQNDENAQAQGDDKQEAKQPEDQKNQEETEKSKDSDSSESKASDVSAYKAGVKELAKAKEGKEVDFQAVIDLYKSDLQPLVQKQDSAVDQQIVAALEAGKAGELDGYIVKQIFDKLTQKVFYLTIKHEFKEVEEYWGDSAEVNKEIEEAKEFYAVLKGTVSKRDNAYSTNMVDQIEAGFNEIEKAVENDDLLGFQLGKQVVDKTLMKTFYLASGALPHGYATKAAKEAKEDVAHAKVEQAEGWAFYQSLTGYLTRHAKEEAALIESQFNLEKDVTKLDPTVVNNAFVRGFSKIALHEYEESEEYWGKDKSVITALEGALFIDMIDTDITRILGKEAFTELTEQAQSYLDAAKAGEKEKAMKVLEKIEGTLKTVIENTK